MSILGYNVIERSSEKEFDMERGGHVVEHNGMRRGISLVEIMIAIVLFGVVTSLSFTYYKTYYDTSQAAKQTRVSVVTDQAKQLTNAFQLYNTKYGEDPSDTDALIDARLLTATPIAQPMITSTGWVLDSNLSLDDNVTGGGVGFVYKIDSSTAPNVDKLDYCNILNNNAHASWGFDTNETSVSNETDMWAMGDSNASSQLNYFFCSDSNLAQDVDSYDFKMVFVIRDFTL